MTTAHNIGIFKEIQYKTEKILIEKEFLMK